MTYDHFGWPGRVEARIGWERYLAAQKGYRPNTHAVDAQLQERITQQLDEVLTRYGYSRRPPACGRS